MDQNKIKASTITQFNHLRIPLEDVQEATNNFDAKNVIGQGDLGKVYKGKLLRSGKWVKIAARRLDDKHKQGIEFLTEISALSSLEHENIVSFIGFCDENGEKVIINKHAAKGSLSMYLSKPTLTWLQRLKIGVGVARALSYIHKGNGRGYSIIHRNINSSTILLNRNFEAKLSGFEYSINHSVHRMDQVLFSEAIGTKGYIDPAIEKIQGVTYKSDIYSFGVVLWELFCGRKAFIPDRFDRFLAPLARYHYEHDIGNEITQPDIESQSCRKSLLMFAKTAYSCSHDERVQRPDMNFILDQLEEALELQLPYENLYKKDLEHMKLRLSHLKIRLADIISATENFSEAYYIGETAFYDLYSAELEHLDTEKFAFAEEKSELPKRRTNVVIKRIPPGEDKQEEEDVFFTEIEMLATCKHRNIVTLLGFCDEGSEMILVTEHAYNGYLEYYLRNIKDEPILTWAQRLKICLDVAHGLNYLHHEMEDQKVIINRDVTSAAITLDENWGAKIVDFGYSLFLPSNLDDDTLYLNSFKGSVGFIDPEYFDNGKLKRESDVYSFGVVLCVILCGRLSDDPIYIEEHDDGLASVARRCFHVGTIKEIMDPIIKEESNGDNCNGPNENSLETFVKIANQCIAKTQDRRPTMKVVIKELEKALSFQEQVQHQDIGQVVDEFDKSLELNLTHANLGDIMENLNIRLDDIKLATNNFSDAYCIKNTELYEIYRAEFEHFNKEIFSFEEEKNTSELPERRTTALVKRFLPREDKKEERLFFTEIEMLSTCKHHNIVILLGICYDGFEKILIIEHFSNGYLDDYLFNVKNKHILTWEERLKICLDVAHGLNYMHYEMEDQKMIIHRHISSSAIALDENLGAKIVDLDLSVFLPPNQDDDALHHDKLDGRYGYADPEYVRTGKLKRESDVYSFGVVLIEILCGRLASDHKYIYKSHEALADVARRCFKAGTLKDMTDPIIQDECGDKNYTLNRGPNKDSLDTVLKLAYECLEETQDQRPTMKVVLKELEKALFFQMSRGDGASSYQLQD